MTELEQHIIEKIKILRDQRRFSDNQIASELGMTPSGFSKIITGQRNIKVEFLEKLARIFELPVYFFFFDFNHDTNFKTVLWERLCDSLESQHTLQEIAQASGINEFTLHEFLMARVHTQLNSSEIERLSAFLGMECPVIKERRNLLTAILTECGVESKIDTLLEYIEKDI